MTTNVLRKDQTQGMLILIINPFREKNLWDTLFIPNKRVSNEMKAIP